MPATAPSHAPTTRPAAPAPRSPARAGVALLALLALAAPGAAAAYSKTFSAGSLIIPAQQEYQTDAGMVSAYGLVYTILVKNGARVAAGKKPIAVNWIIEPRKQSHYRCWTGDDTLPSYSTYNDNDGCDFTVQNSSGSPVARLDSSFNEVSPFWACGIDATFNYNIGRNPAVCDASTVAAAGGVSGPKDFPAFQVGPSKKVMKYSGSGWVIEAAFRDDVLQLLANDPDVAIYHKNGVCTGGGSLNSGCHYVNIHSAKASFTAPVARMINVKPPLIALLGSGAVTILEGYLANAGLDSMPNHAGPLARDPTTGVITQHGVIYDVLDPVTDFVSKAFSGPLAHGILNYPLDGVDPMNGTFYQVMWAPHWVAAIESTLPKDGSLGDDAPGGGWTHNGDDPITDAMKNIAYFADLGNGVFAACAAIESFEGSYKATSTTCNGTFACEYTIDPTQTAPYQCAAGYTPACNACYSCGPGLTLNASSCGGEVTCVGTCAAGTTPACNSCYSCPAGYSVNALDCNHVNCTPAVCPAGYTTTCGGCYSCNAGYTMSVDPICATPPTCHQCRNAGYVYSPGLGQCTDCSGGTKVWNEAALKCYSGGLVTTYKTGTEVAPQPANVAAGPAPTATPTSTFPPLRQDATCQAGYALFCPGATLPIDVPGNDATHFQVSNRIGKNGLGNSFSGADCTDRAATVVGYHDTSTGDCFNFHPEVGAPANVFTQMGNFNYAGTGGHVHQYLPPSIVGSLYWPNVFHMVTSSNSLDSTRDGWDFATQRHKDGDPTKGMVVYLAGHSYANNAGGTRLVLNALLNLGFSMAGVELARSEPVGFTDNTVSPATNRVYQGTYVQLPPPSPFQDWAEYTVGSPQSWRFPYTAGHLYEYDLSALGSTQQTFGKVFNWDAALRMPLPGARTIFTALGGSGNLGWTKVNFSHTETEFGCVDQDADGKCDLSEQLAACATAGVTTAALQASTVAGTQRDTLGMFVQQVRGFCSAHTPAITGSPVFEPADSACDNLKLQKNRAKLGGLDHGSPALVGPSRYVTDAPWNTRPTMAYAGARDGMLHAFYVSGNTNWRDPSNTKLPVGVQAGQEIWAFVPPGQICGLATNNAMVDASVNVIDVFGNFPTDANGDGVIDWTSSTERPTGLRTWRTVLLAAAGQGGSELFAMDVTNPLKPVLLWHIGGATEKDARWDANASGTFDPGEVFDPGDPRTYAIKWTDTPAANGMTSSKTGRYDYRNLGLTYGTAVGKVWEGSAYRYIAYVATSTADFTDASAPLGYRGLDVFAFDLVTGQKLWQWERRYTRVNTSGTVIADNTIPGRLALADVDADGSVDRIYVGDMEGHLWELDALGGANLNYLASKADSTKRYSFPFFGASDMQGTGATSATTSLFAVTATQLAQQPLTSPIGLGRFTQVPTTPKDLTSYLLNRLAIVQGTMGVDWAIAPFEFGHVFVLPVYWEQPSRVAYFTSGDSVDLSATPDPLLYGLLKNAAVWDTQLLQGERVFGMPRIVNNQIVFNTSFGSFTGDITDTTTDIGNLYIVKPDATTTVTPNDSKSFGGVLVFKDKLIISTATGIKATDVTAAMKGDTPSQRPFNRSTPAIFKTWEPPDFTTRKQ